MTGSPESSTAAPAQVSLIEDCIDIWSSPSKVFARRRTGPYWGPYFVCAVLLVALFFAAFGPMQAVFDAEVTRMIAKATAENPSIPADQLASMQKMMEGSMKYGGIFAIPIVLLCLGLVVFLVAKIFGGELSFGGGVMVASFAYFPRVLDTLLVTVQSMVLDTSTWTGKYQWSLGVGRFMDPSGPQGMINLLGRIDVFTIWVTILIAFGLQYAGKLPKEKAYMGAALIWVLGALGPLYQIMTGQ